LKYNLVFTGLEYEKCVKNSTEKEKSISQEPKELEGWFFV